MPELANATLAELADLIEREHHGFLREWLPRLSRLLAEAGLGAAEPLRLRFESLRTVLDQHLVSEERRVFPLIRALEARGRRRDPAAPLGAATDLLEHLEFEHGIVGQMLGELREMVAATPAAGAFREALEALDANLREHVRLENDFLFPRAKALDHASSAPAQRRDANADHH